MTIGRHSILVLVAVVVQAIIFLSWLIPFSLLLSRDIKRNKKRLVRVCQWMIFAKAFDLFWLIEPNFKDAARNAFGGLGGIIRDPCNRTLCSRTDLEP